MFILPPYAQAVGRIAVEEPKGLGMNRPPYPTPLMKGSGPKRIVVSVVRDPMKPQLLNVRVVPGSVLTGDEVEKTVSGRANAIRMVTDLLKAVFNTGDAIEYAAILFTSVDEVVRALHVALG